MPQAGKNYAAFVSYVIAMLAYLRFLLQVSGENFPSSERGCNTVPDLAGFAIAGGKLNCYRLSQSF